MVVRRSALQRSGDKNAPAAPYKHRLAHAPGSRRFGFPGGRSGASGFQGAALNRFCILLSAQKDAPAGQAYKPRFLKGLRRRRRLQTFTLTAPPAGVQIVTLR